MVGIGLRRYGILFIQLERHRQPERFGLICREDLYDNGREERERNGHFRFAV
jgi:hypothetical protein